MVVWFRRKSGIRVLSSLMCTSHTGLLWVTVWLLLFSSLSFLCKVRALTWQSCRNIVLSLRFNVVKEISALDCVWTLSSSCYIIIALLMQGRD